MAGISKRVSGSWVSGDERVMKTATDTITTLPADLYADGNSATIGLKGNMSQTGTPTPQNPITPQETGERTENLWGVPIVQGAVSDTGDLIYYTTRVRGEYIPIQPETQYTISCNKAIRTIYAYYNQAKVSPIYTGSSQITTKTFTTPENCNSICVGFMNDPSSANLTPSDIEFVMLNTGSTALPYEPHGVKILISSANTTTPVYLGEAESTRQIYKLVLTGNETGWYAHATQSNLYVLAVTDYLFANTMASICSHYTTQVASGASSIPDKKLAFYYYAGSPTTRLMYIKDTSFADLTSFKQYLAAQYAAGTPVTVWYVLAESETGIVNEPIRKIGNYADTVSGITIPTIAGADTVSVDTTLQPSEVSVTYHGWHEGTVKDYENGDWQPQAQALSLSNAPMLSMVMPDMSEPVIEPETTE